ncbi:putative 40S ribosomal protein S3 [Atractiella rhizophila]|nr:putative 40S ribosomal protein S3 [Atractiella rhizophila]
MSSGTISKRRKFVADGVFYAELNDFFTRELSSEGYSGCEVRVAHAKTEIIIRATHTQEVLGEKVTHRGLSAVAQAESLRYKLLQGLAYRRACYGVVRFVMESGAKGVEVVVSGKLRAARAKSMKFTDGFMIHSGQPARDFVDEAVRHVLLRQGVLGIKVKIMKPWDPEGKTGPKRPLPDMVTIVEPKKSLLHQPPLLTPGEFHYQPATEQAAPEVADVIEEQVVGEVPSGTKDGWGGDEPAAPVAEASGWD